MTEAWPGRVAAGGEHDQLAAERVLVEQVEQVLEQAGVRALVDRAADHQHVGALDRAEDAPDLGSGLRAIHRLQQRRAGVDQVEQRRLAEPARGGGVEHRLHQRARARGARPVAADADDARRGILRGGCGHRGLHAPVKPGEMRVNENNAASGRQCAELLQHAQVVEQRPMLDQHAIADLEQVEHRRRRSCGRWAPCRRRHRCGCL